MTQYVPLRMFTSPSRGSYISTMLPNRGTLVGIVLVPFSGFLYLYGFSNKFSTDEKRFSSPSRGSYISTAMNMLDMYGVCCSRPLLGVLISLQVYENDASVC